MAPQRVYLIGAGVIAGFHAQALDHLPDGRRAELIVTTRDPARLQAFLKAHPRARPVPDADRMLAEPARPTDIVVVTTPPAWHCRWTCRALESGRNVLCEKPLAVNRREATRMVALARRRKRLLADCAGRFLNLAINQAVRGHIAAGTLGDLYLLTFVHRTARGRGGVEYQPESPWFVQKKFAGGGILLDWGPYDLNHLIELYRPRAIEIRHAWAATPQAAAKLPRGVRIDVDEHAGAALLMHLPDGSRLPVTYERAACTHGRECRIMELDGTRGSLAWDWTNWNDRTLIHRFDRAGRVAEKKRVFPVDPIGPHAKPLVYLHAAVHGAPLADGVILADARRPRTRPPHARQPHARQPSADRAAVNQAALRRFELLCALYDCIADSKSRTVRLSPADSR
ncbi:MAG: Gfo/Idh/MocA family protein [Planctomycetota bacterium]